MPEKLNVKVGTASESKPKAPPIQIKPTLPGVINWIKNKHLAPDLEVRMIAKAKRWPHTALSKFVEDFGANVIKIQKRRNDGELLS